MTMRMKGIFSTTVVILSLALASPALATVGVKLKVGFTPNRPNASTTIHFGFTITTPRAVVPPPVTAIALQLPVGMGLGLTTLGEEVCTMRTLEARGPAGCSQNALMGRGHALIELPVGTQVVRSTATVEIFMGPPIRHHTVMLFDVLSVTPVSAEIPFPGELVPDMGGLGASLDTLVPVIASWPEGADASVVRMQSTLGPEHLTYYRRVHGHRVAYRPIGMAVPASCPGLGYRFVVKLVFADETSAQAASNVPCRH